MSEQKRIVCFYFMEIQDDLIQKLQKEKESAITFQKRRHNDWKEVYELYRNIIETNELTQRQETNIPILKETVKNILARISETPDITFNCLEKGTEGRQKEIIIQEIWQDDFDKCNFELLDLLEKKNVLLYGRTFKFLNFVNNKFVAEVPDNLDIVIDPKTNPIDIETARYIIRLHIYKPLREIIHNDKYTKEGREELARVLKRDEEDEGGDPVEFTENDNQEAKEEIRESLDINEFMGGADTIVELNEHFTEIWDPVKKKYIRYVIIVAANSVILYKKTLKETLGVEFYPATTWADDLDTKDFWTDGVGDIVRDPNKVMNVYFSTMMENRVYRNLGMTWYLPADGYSPQTFEPEPFGQYPAPMVSDGRGGVLPVEQVIKQMDIPALEDNLISIDFLIKLIEKATSATAIEKGVPEKKQTTLGEVEKLIQSSDKTIANISKFYNRASREFAWKWRKIREANALKNSPIKLYKKGVKGSYFEKEVYQKDWVSKAGYKEKVTSRAEQDYKNSEDLQKLIIVSERFPNNIAIQKIIQGRMIEMLKLNPEELHEIKSAERSENIQGEEQQNSQPQQGIQPLQIAPKPV